MTDPGKIMSKSLIIYKRKEKYCFCLGGKSNFKRLFLPRISNKCFSMESAERTSNPISLHVLLDDEQSQLCVAGSDRTRNFMTKIVLCE